MRARPQGWLAKPERGLNVAPAEKGKEAVREDCRVCINKASQGLDVINHRDTFFTEAVCKSYMCPWCPLSDMSRDMQRQSGAVIV